MSTTTIAISQRLEIRSQSNLMLLQFSKEVTYKKRSAKLFLSCKKIAILKHCQVFFKVVYIEFDGLFKLIIYIDKLKNGIYLRKILEQHSQKLMSSSWWFRGNHTSISRWSIHCDIGWSWNCHAGAYCGGKIIFES